MNMDMSGVCFPLPFFAAEHAKCPFFTPVALSLRRSHPTKSDQHALQPVSIL